MSSQEVINCPDCKGEGVLHSRIVDNICPTCEGTGEVWYDDEDDYAYIFPTSRNNT